MVSMEEIEEVYKKFENNLDLVDQINEIGLDVSRILSNSLEDLRKKNEEVSGCYQIKQNIGYTISIIDDIKNHPLLKEKYEIIYNQSVVLVVADFESFMHGLVKEIVDNYPNMVAWPDKERISFDPTLLTYAFPTVGDIVVRSLREKTNFQDLQSILRFLDKYLNISLKLKNELKDRIILYHAYRNAIMHDFSQRDDSFLKQIRDIKVDNKIREVGQIRLTEVDYLDARKAFLSLAKIIMKNIRQKLEAEA